MGIVPSGRLRLFRRFAAVREISPILSGESPVRDRRLGNHTGLITQILHILRTPNRVPLNLA
jgi:hypothetical protein